MGLSVKAVVQMLSANRDGNVVAFLIGTLSTVLLQSASQSLYIAGEMVSSDQLNVQSGILFAIGTSIGVSALPVMVAMMAGCRLHLTRAVWGIASFQVLKLLSLGACARTS
jgi:Na+/phosphate symporter